MREPEAGNHREGCFRQREQREDSFWSLIPYSSISSSRLDFRFWKESLRRIVEIEKKMREKGEI